MTRCLVPNVAAIYTDERGRRRLVADGRLLSADELAVACGRARR